MPFFCVIRHKAAMARPRWRRASVAASDRATGGFTSKDGTTNGGRTDDARMMAVDMDGPFPEGGRSVRMGLAVTPFGQTRPSDRAPTRLHSTTAWGFSCTNVPPLSLISHQK